jgi:hypothetical protein
MAKLSMVVGGMGAMLCAVLAGCAAPGASNGAAGGTRSLQDASGGLEAVTPENVALDAVWQPQADGTILVTGKPSGFVATRATYANYRLHAEWRWTGKPGNGGVLLHIASGPKDGVWPLSQQVQTKFGAVGDLLPMAGASFAEPLTTAPGAYPKIKAHAAANSEKPAGEWNTMDVTVKDGAIDVTINGVAQNHVGGSEPRSGRIGFQLEGTPYALRNLRFEKLD